MRFSTHAIVLSTSLFFTGCVVDEVSTSTEPAVEVAEIGSIDQPIINGQVWTGDPAVVAIQAGGLCTGSLIRPNVVITAAHCVVNFVEGQRTVVPAGAVNVIVGNTINPGDQIERIGAMQVFAHRDYFLPENENAANIRNDFAMIRLEEDAITPPVDFNRTPLSNADIDLPVRIVGYGNNDGTAGTGSGIKRAANGLRIAQIQGQFIDLVSEGVGAITCQGDSGGPTFGDPDGNGERVLSVTSFGDAGCVNSASNTRTDIYVDLIDQVLGAWTGPCAADGTCVETGCGDFVDPDCDPCGLNGQCIDGCPQVDLDCPLGRLVGENCENLFQCESRNCIAANDDDRVTFCTSECDPAVSALSQCESPLSACEEAADGKFYCGYAGPTPRTLGAACAGASDCLSGLCDTGDGICVELCPAEGCPEGYECRNIGGDEVCALPGGGGGCGCNADASGGLGALGLALLSGLFLFGFRRRRA